MTMKLFKHILSIFAILACGAAFGQDASAGAAADMNVAAAADKEAKPLEISANENHDIVHLALKVNMDKASEISDDMVMQHLTTALRRIGHAGDLSPFYHSAVAAVKSAISNISEGGTASGNVELALSIPITEHRAAFPDNTIVTSGH